MTNNQIYIEEAKRATLDYACHNYMQPSFLLEEAKNRDFVYTLQEIDNFLELTDQWDKRIETLILLIDCIDIDSKLKKIILKNGNTSNTRKI